MTENLRQGFRLGDYEVHPPSGTIRRPDGAYHVTPSAMDVLVCLAERPGRLVTRAELVERVWRGSDAGEHALTHCIGDLRHQLDDHSDNPVFIQTLPRRGFRLLAHSLTLWHGRDPTICSTYSVPNSRSFGLNSPCGPVPRAH